MPPGLPVWRHLASQEAKCVQAPENEELWPYETLTGPLASSEIVICYALSKLTKRSSKLLKCLQTSHIL